MWRFLCLILFFPACSSNKYISNDASSNGEEISSDAFIDPDKEISATGDGWYLVTVQGELQNLDKLDQSHHFIDGSDYMRATKWKKNIYRRTGYISDSLLNALDQMNLKEIRSNE